MCRFKRLRRVSMLALSMFQYILCVGSRIVRENNGLYKYVFQYILCVGSRLIIEASAVDDVEFQYILCVGSSKR